MSLDLRFPAPNIYEQVLQVARADQLIGYWPLWESSGTFVQGYGAPLEHLLNGGFETAGAGGADIWATWVETAGDGALADEGTIVHSGSHAAKVTAGATANTKIAQTYSTQPGTGHTFSFWTRGDGTNGGRYLVFDVTNNGNIIAATATGVTGTTYTQVTVTFTAPANCVSVRLDLMCPTANGGLCYFDDVSNMAVANGKYTGVTLGLPGAGDGFTSPLFDGSTSFANIYSSGLANAFNGAEGTLIVWSSISSAALTDGLAHYQILIGVNGTTDFIFARKILTNNVYRVGRTASSAQKSVDVTLSGTVFKSWAITWSVSADAVKIYLNGIQQGSTQTGLSAFSGSLGSTTCTVGASTTTPTSVFSGTLAHVALWTTPLTANQINYIAKTG